MTSDHFLLSLKKDINSKDYDRWKRRMLHHRVGHEVEYVLQVPHAPVRVGTRPVRHEGGRDKRRTVGSQSSTPNKDSDQGSVTGKSRKKENFKGLDDVAIERKKTIEKLKLLVKYRKEDINKLEHYCASLLEINLKMVGEIVDTDRKSFFCAQDVLTEHHRLGNYIASFKDWSLCHIRQTKDGLKDAETAAKKRCSVLREQLTVLEAELAKAQAQRDALKTYKEKEFPVQGLKAAEIRRQIDSLRETQQHELEDVSRICQTVMADLRKKYTEQEEEILSAAAEEELLCAPPALLLMVSHNYTMKREIDLHKKEIKELEETCEELLKSVKELRRSQATTRQAFFNPPAPQLTP